MPGTKVLMRSYIFAHVLHNMYNKGVAAAMTFCICAKSKTKVPLLP